MSHWRSSRLSPYCVILHCWTPRKTELCSYARLATGWTPLELWNCPCMLRVRPPFSISNCHKERATEPASPTRLSEIRSQTCIKKGKIKWEWTRKEWAFPNQPKFADLHALWYNCSPIRRQTASDDRWAPRDSAVGAEFFRRHRQLGVFWVTNSLRFIGFWNSVPFKKELLVLLILCYFFDQIPGWVYLTALLSLITFYLPSSPPYTPLVNRPPCRCMLISRIEASNATMDKIYFIY